MSKDKRPTIAECCEEGHSSYGNMLRNLAATPVGKDKRADTPRMENTVISYAEMERRDEDQRRDKGDDYSGERFGDNERFVEANPIEKFPSGGWIYPTGKGWELTKRDNVGRRKGERRQAT